MYQTLKQARLQKGLTAESVADLAVTSSTVLSEIETGKRFPSPRLRQRIESILGEVDWVKNRLSQMDLEQGPLPEVVSAMVRYVHESTDIKRKEKIRFLQLVLHELAKRP